MVQEKKKDIAVKFEYLNRISWEYKINKSLTFLFPLIGLNMNTYGHFIVNGYLMCDFDKINSQYKNRIYCLINKEKIDDKLEVEIKSKTHFMKEIDLPFSNICIYSFIIPNNFNTDYLLVRNGKYSKTSLEYKKRIIATYCTDVNLVVDKENSIYKILHPNDEIINNISRKYDVSIELISEIISIPDIVNEIFSLDTLYELKV